LQAEHVREEMLVTARRREESARDVPLALSTLTAADLEQRNVENIEDLQVLLPNVDIRGGNLSPGSTGQFAIRGIPGVARYVDGVAHSGPEGALENVIELERIEVVRGPQGTLFGKNAVGGAIQYVTRKPGAELGARLKLAIGDFHRTDLVANVDVPLGGKVRTKLTAASLRRDGYVDSVTTDESYGEQNQRLVRAMVDWRPNRTVEALFTAERTRQDENAQANVLWNVFEEAATPRDYNAAGIPFSDELYAFAQRRQYQTAIDYRGTGNNVETASLTADLRWHVAANLTLHSISSGRRLDWGSWQDFDGTQLVQYERWNYARIDETTQELQLTGERERWDWIAGVYYFRREQLAKQSNWQRYEIVPQRLFQDLGRTATTDNALFGEVSYAATNHFTLTLGGRQSTEDFEFTTYDSAEPMPPPHTASRSLDGTVQLRGGKPLEGNDRFQRFTPRMTASYRVGDAIMAYATIAQGFDGGGINTRYDPTLPNDGIIPYDSTTLTNLELGMRATLARGRLQLDATWFDGDWENIQVGEVLTPGTLTITNAAEAKIQGLEVQGVLRAGGFALNFTLGLLDTGYTDIGRATTIAIDTPFPFAPRHTYSVGVQQTIPLRGGAVLTGRVDYGWIDDVETIRDARFQVSAFDSAYGLLTAHVTYAPAAARWQVAVFGTNLTNEYYRLGGVAAYAAGIDVGVVARPRELGADFTLRL